jgi:hypothetical protein
VIRQYQDLWTELGERRRRCDELGPVSNKHVRHPLRQDPFTLFASYATTCLKGDSQIRLSESARNGDKLRTIPARSINVPPVSILASAEEVRQITDIARQGAATVADIIRAGPESQQASWYRTIAWLAKMGVVELVESPTSD